MLQRAFNLLLYRSVTDGDKVINLRAKKQYLGTGKKVKEVELFE